ncbi:hypothetical protein ACH3VR_07430 [Microbacterium sp. B2969]|uniref:DUF4345 domain-containing protein n=1 Tax=Microbacterium alkaliflavum TaxID=3248839 RepID=A0ABW7Q5P1_9MICO
MTRGLRLTLVTVTAFVAVTALAGGIALILGSTVPALSSVLVPPADYLRGSPFDSYAVPGLTLILFVGAPQALAGILTGVRWRFAMVACAAAGFSCAIWIFVQMIFIPFSPLQAVYFVIGMLELGLVMLGLGVLRPLTPPKTGSHRERRTRVP